MVHGYLAYSSVTYPSAGASAPSIFPRYSARVVKEALAVICLVLVATALVMVAVHLTPAQFGGPPGSITCTTLNEGSLFSPWCSALI